MSFADDMKRFEVKVVAKSAAVLANTASHAFESVVNGSAVTGAPGQPVDTGFLRNSWNLTFPAQNEALIATACEYAEHVESNVRGVTFNNHGPHSVGLTIAGMSRIVEHEALKVANG